jgi:hypothetical protein
MLKASAVLALCKFMCVSADFCEKHLSLLFTLAERSKEAEIRANVVIAMVTKKQFQSILTKVLLSSSFAFSLGRYRVTFPESDRAMDSAFVRAIAR